MSKDKTEPANEPTLEDIFVKHWISQVFNEAGNPVNVRDGVFPAMKEYADLQSKLKTEPGELFKLNMIEIAKLRAENAELQNHYEKWTDELAAKTNKVLELKAENAAKDKEIEELKTVKTNLYVKLEAYREAHHKDQLRKLSLETNFADMEHR